MDCQLKQADRAARSFDTHDRAVRLVRAGPRAMLIALAKLPETPVGGSRKRVSRGEREELSAEMALSGNISERRSLPITLRFIDVEFAEVIR